MDNVVVDVSLDENRGLRLRAPVICWQCSKGGCRGGFEQADGGVPWDAAIQLFDFPMEYAREEPSGMC